MTGALVREKRSEIGLSQAKLSTITGIIQAKLSAFELGKQELNSKEKEILINTIENINKDKINSIKKKRYLKRDSTTSRIDNIPRRTYKTTLRNSDYLKSLNKLENKFKNSKKTNLKAISFFAGCGGLCYGVKAAGFDIVATNELVDAYKDIYKMNFPNANFLKNDIQKITENDINILLKKHKNIDLLVGGPPCQGFSLSGKRDVEDKRNTLFEDYLAIAKQIMPKVVLIENVKLLTSMKDPNGELVKDRILKTFDEIGYNSKFFFVNAKDYGVAQDRKRVIFLGVKKNIKTPIIIAEPKYGEKSDLFNHKKECFSLGDAVSDLKFLEAGEKDDTDKHHWAVNHPPHVINWLVDVPQGKSAHDNEDSNLRPPSGYNTTYKRQEWNKPAGTVATTYGMISGCRNVHPIATRALTTREALRLQSFPDSFKIDGKTGDIRTVIGNSVPPLLAYEIAKHILDNYIL